jgi:hypothetical protein
MIRAVQVKVALVGGAAPDLRGLFLRGVGGNAAALGVTQDDAVGISTTGNGIVGDIVARDYGGAFRPSGSGHSGRWPDVGKEWWQDAVGLDLNILFSGKLGNENVGRRRVSASCRW